MPPANPANRDDQIAAHAVASSIMTRAWLAERLARGMPQQSAVVGDQGGSRLPQLTAAAVLVPIVGRDAGPTVLLTQRTAHLNDHAGQISFPGGRSEQGDASAVDTALRETLEEIGVARQHVEVLGQLPEYTTRTGFRVTPIVGFLEPPFDIAPDTFEVEEVFEVPLVFLLNPANHQQHSRVHEGITRHYWAMPYGEHYIWGATAGMLINLYRCLTAVATDDRVLPDQ